MPHPTPTAVPQRGSAISSPGGNAGHIITAPQRPTSTSTYSATVGCVIPAYNEAETIASVLESLLAQTRLPDVIHVVVNNTSDDSVQIAANYAGPHARVINGVESYTEVFIHDIGENPDKKVGALNYGYSLVEGMDYFLGVDGDTTADPRAVEHLLAEIESDGRIGGISAIYSIEDAHLQGPVAKWLVAGQRQQFASFNMQNLLRGRQMAVLGGQYSIFRVAALQRVVEEFHQLTPWVRDSEIEDSLLSLQIRSTGFLTKISAQARADVGAMTTLRSLDAQQVKWNVGAIDLMWPGQRGDTQGQPFHPNLRLRWFENFSMLLNALTRFGFVTLVICSVLFGAFVFNPVWLLPPFIATALNLRVVRSMHDATLRDYLFALLWFPSELYIWARIGHFVRAWTKFFSGSETDNWALQSKAESGGGGNVHWSPHVAMLLAIGTCVLVFLQLSTDWRSNVLWVGWNALAIITILQSGWLLLKCLRRYKGFKV